MEHSKILNNFLNSGYTLTNHTKQIYITYMKGVQLDK
jgi:hypothetical protein